MDRLIADYEYRLEKLRLWPEKTTIFELTKFAELNPKIANHVADILISRIIDVPLFYLVDSVLRNVGGPYIPLFSSHIVEVFRRVFDELNEKDKARLDYMLSTWEERRILPRELVIAMRNHIGTRIVCIPIPVPHFRPLEGPHFADLHRARDMQMWDRDRPPMGEFEDRRLSLRGRDVEREREKEKERGFDGDQNLGPLFKQNLRREMMHLLDEMYADMAIHEERIPLDELLHSNPALFHQIRHTAEAVVHERMRAGGPVVGKPSDGARRFSQGMTQGHGHEAKRPRVEPREVVRAFVGEVPVTVEVPRNHRLVARLRSTKPTPAIAGSSAVDTKGASRSGLDVVRARLSAFLQAIHIPPPLPSLFSGPMPVGKEDDSEASKSAAAQEQHKEEKPQGKRVSPPFRADDLNKHPSAALRALYVDRRFCSRQDGLRFLTQQELGAHLDTLFVRNRGKQRKGDRECRSWYCTIPQWVSDFSSLTQAAPEPTDSSAMDQVAGDSDEEMVVPADEQFPRCPVSNEAFLQEWDEEEGDFVYRNAVKVLVTEDADPILFRLSKPTASQPPTGPELRYVIVHKHLVLDRWLASAKVESLRESSGRLRGEGRAVEAGAVAQAAGEDEDEVDVFVLVALPTPTPTPITITTLTPIDNSSSSSVTNEISADVSVNTTVVGVKREREEVEDCADDGEMVSDAAVNGIGVGIGIDMDTDTALSSSIAREVVSYAETKAGDEETMDQSESATSSNQSAEAAVEHQSESLASPGPEVAVELESGGGEAVEATTTVREGVDGELDLQGEEEEEEVVLGEGEGKVTEAPTAEVEEMAVDEGDNDVDGHDVTDGLLLDALLPNTEIDGNAVEDSSTEMCTDF